MAAVWLVLRVLLWVLAGLLVLLLIALVLPVGANITWEKGALTVDARAAFVRLRVYPLARRTKRAKPGKQRPARRPKQPPQQAAAEGKPGAEASAKPAEPKPAKEPPIRLEFTLTTIRALASTAGGLIRRVLRGIRVYDITLRLPVHGQDAADTALRYGRLNALLHTTLAAVSNLMRVECKQLALAADFTDEYKGQETFSCKITTRLIIMVTAGIWALYRLWRAGFFALGAPKPTKKAKKTKAKAAQTAAAAK